jgi:hypothetical protein
MLGVVAERVMVDGYAAWRCPRSSFTTRSQEKTGVPGYVLFGVGLWTFYNGVVALYLAWINSILVTPAGQRSIHGIVEFGSLIFGIGLVRVVFDFDDLSYFLASTNFRVWMRAVRSPRAVAIAHAYYYNGFYRRAGDRAMSIALLQLSIVLLHWFFGAPTGSASGRLLLSILAGAMIGLLIVSRLVSAVWSTIRPDIDLAGVCTFSRNRMGSSEPTGRQSRGVVRPGRWRGPAHLASFRAAELVERCLPPVLRRFGQADAAQISLAARKIAESLRAHALHTKDDPVRFAERKVLAVRIVASDDPLGVADAIMALTSEEPNPPPLAARPFGKLADNTNDTMSRYWPSMRVAIVVVALVVVLVSGRYSEVAGLFGQ